MSTALVAGRRAQRRYRIEQALLLDGGVDLLMEDSWRNPFSDDPLRPRRGSAYPFGKQVAAHMIGNSAAEREWIADMLPWLQGVQRNVVAGEQREARAIVTRRLRAAESPTATIPPKTSVPGVEQVIAELERRTHLPIAEIRANIHAEVVERAVWALVRYHRMVHPVFEQKERYGRQQWLEARETWREFTGSTVAAQNDRLKAFETFGELVDEDGSYRPMDYDLDRRDDERNYLPRRSPRTPKRPQILPRLAEALGVSESTVKRMIRRTSEEVEGQIPSRQEASCSSR